MQRKKSFEIIGTDWKIKLLEWTKKYPLACYLDSNRYYDGNPNKTYECLVGVSRNPYTNINPFDPGFKLLNEASYWTFGFFTYDLKNEFEKLSSNNIDEISMPSYHFFIPEYVFEIIENEVTIHFNDRIMEDNINQIFEDINNIEIRKKLPNTQVPVIKQRITKEQYVDIINKIKKHIAVGDIYEMNYCMEFYIDDFQCKPTSLFARLKTVSPMPFSCFYRVKDKYLLCASPERFMMKKGQKVISQPIKGTIKRDLMDLENDERLKQQLYNDSKERSENVMIVDLVRNDLSRTAKKGSVKVEEMFGIYTFRQVHQMISTVTSEVDGDITFKELIRTTFPMGSMTGAPKIRAMQLIEEYELTKRGLYSGSVGYITADNDFDFNVVIRSIIYDSSKKFWSFMVGSSITFDSIPDKEYEECLLKAKAIMQVLTEK